MPIIYKIEVMETLKAAGFSTYKIRKDKIFGEATLQQIRNGEIVSNACLAKLCELLECQPGDIIKYVADTPSNTYADVKDTNSEHFDTTTYIQDFLARRNNSK